MDRFLGNVLDYMILLVVMFILGNIVMVIFVGDASPHSFVVMMMMIYPLMLIYNICIYPQAYNCTPLIVGMMIFLFVLEVTYFSISEFIMNGVTVGRKATKMVLVKNGNGKITFGAILLRNIMKTATRYVYCIPVLLMFFSKERKMFYDVILKLNVIKQRDV